MIGGMILIGVCCFIAGIIIRGCIDYHKEIKLELAREKADETKPLVKEISWKELTDIVKSFEEKEADVPLDEFVAKWMQEDHSEDVPLEVKSDAYVVINPPCIGNDCACSPVKEDCCPGDYDNGRCKVVININKLCGIDDIIKRDAKLVTPTEAEMLAKVLKNYYASIEEAERKRGEKK